ncbi:hypothetical protein GE09DRAFT_303016 [Coniochaeta sp. 2T2.1]|nr:hypothetical protein GE09DRAFT_303016 [Coniochaeta sp. 2T2.1]
MQTSTGCGICEPFLLPDKPPEAPSWRPVSLGPLSWGAASDYLQPMDAGEKFHFGHADLSPTNIIVSDDGQVRGVVDWESAAFYPHDWIATKARIAYGFILEDVDPEQIWEWRRLFVFALGKRQFEVDVEGFRLFIDKIKNK